ncbi:membrane protein of unknown function [Candidatus Hydrogenisulfobacillus filiaventi]|uniref:Type II secretion system protein GspF domain-containing protein n=2 Tax=Candidatus Hydrogenisulfobacillus filiaventi TaxID=2707344 RepID=A0A6F8ZH47_9FIRM|nr:hypothetical protein [Bacillota bacterium]CAB1129207.1 membrane protein of unknown function [Candidatus Hydrogenisulfobacillus filiaventi]
MQGWAQAAWAALAAGLAWLPGEAETGAVLAAALLAWIGAGWRSAGTWLMAGAVLAAGAGGAAIHRRRRQRQVAAARRRAAAVLLEAIALYLAAGSGFWPAVEGAVAMAGDPGLREVARAVLAGEVPAPLPAEWEELVTWLGRGHQGGMAAAEAERQLEAWSAREEAVQARAAARAPLWLALLSALQLLNVLVLLAYPMVILAGRGLAGLP